MNIHKHFHMPGSLFCSAENTVEKTDISLKELPAKGRNKELDIATWSSMLGDEKSRDLY
jgi:hypothetical protein